MNEPYHTRTEIRQVGPDRWREFEIWSRPGTPFPNPALDQERPGKFYRPVAPSESVEDLRAAGRACMISDAYTNTWITEE